MFPTRALLIGSVTLLLCQSVGNPPPVWARSSAPAPETQGAVDRAGDVLPAGAIARLGTLRWRYDGSATTLAYSPDGRILAGSCAGKIILWESATGKRIRQLPIGAAGWPSRHSLRFSADPQVL